MVNVLGLSLLLSQASVALSSSHPIARLHNNSFLHMLLKQLILSPGCACPARYTHPRPNPQVHSAATFGHFTATLSQGLCDGVFIAGWEGADPALKVLSMSFHVLESLLGFRGASWEGL